MSIETIAALLLASACDHQEDPTGGQEPANRCGVCITLAMRAAVAEAVGAEMERCITVIEDTRREGSLPEGEAMVYIRRIREGVRGRAQGGGA